jgi:hypothetical protein
MMENITNIYKRISELQSSGKNLEKILKPEEVTEFESMFKQMQSKMNPSVKGDQEIHPLLKTKEVVKEDPIEISGTASAIQNAVKKSGEKYGLSEDLIRAVIQVESGFNPKSVSRAGAMGLMQLMPKTALELGVEKPFDIAENIDGGSRYLKLMLDRYEGDLDKALAAYNAGPHRVDAANGIPDIEETKNYVKMIKKLILK